MALRGAAGPGRYGPADMLSRSGGAARPTEGGEEPMNRCALVLSVLVAASTAVGQMTLDFEDLTLDANGFWNGSDGAGGFDSRYGHFNNTYNPTYGSWAQWAYSGRTNGSTDSNASAGWSNQYSAVAGGAQDGNVYGVGYVSAWDPAPKITFGGVIDIDGFYVTNTSYTYWSMAEGDAFAKQFGTGADPNDWLLLTTTGLDASGDPTGTVDFYLADFRFANGNDDYIVGEWTWVDLSSLGEVKALEFAMGSSDVGAFGINTPTYFAMDALVPEPAATALLALGGTALLRRRRRWRATGA
jgi:hypothetical protein